MDLGAFSSLPNVGRVAVLDFLVLKDLTLCREVSKEFKTTVEGSASRLHLAGQSDAFPSDAFLGNDMHDPRLKTVQHLKGLRDVHLELWTDGPGSRLLLAYVLSQTGLQRLRIEVNDGEGLRSVVTSLSTSRALKLRSLEIDTNDDMVFGDAADTYQSSEALKALSSNNWSQLEHVTLGQGVFNTDMGQALCQWCLSPAILNQLRRLELRGISAEDLGDMELRLRAKHSERCSKRLEVVKLLGVKGGKEWPELPWFLLFLLRGATNSLQELHITPAFLGGQTFNGSQMTALMTEFETDTVAGLSACSRLVSLHLEGLHAASAIPLARAIGDANLDGGLGKRRFQSLRDLTVAYQPFGPVDAVEPENEHAVNGLLDPVIQAVRWCPDLEILKVVECEQGLTTAQITDLGNTLRNASSGSNLRTLHLGSTFPSRKLHHLGRSAALDRSLARANVSAASEAQVTRAVTSHRENQAMIMCRARNGSRCCCMGCSRGPLGPLISEPGPRFGSGAIKTSDESLLNREVLSSNCKEEAVALAFATSVVPHLPSLQDLNLHGVIQVPERTGLNSRAAVTTACCF